MTAAALIFDFDGLILDTESPEYQSWSEIFAEHGGELPLEKWAVAIGTAAGVFDPYAELERQIGRPVGRSELRSRRRARTLALLEGMPVLPGVTEYLEEARVEGLKLGVASSSPSEWVEGHLSRLGLTAYFGCIQCMRAPFRAKPHPDLYQGVLESLGVSPAHAIALEDSPNGILAAKRAGLFCVAVPNPLTVSLDLKRADLVVPLLKDISLRSLLQLSRRRAGASDDDSGDEIEALSVRD